MHNGIKWGLAREMVSGLVGDLHISIEAVLNSIASLRSHLGPWLARVVSFTGAQSHDLAGRWWRFLGIEPDWLDLFAEVRPYWSNGHLHVNPALIGDDASMSKITSCWVYCMRWQHFTESRWCGIGAACRCVLRSLSIGLEDLVKETRSNKTVSDYFLGGFTRMTAQVKRYIAVASAGTRPAEAFALEVLEDDRVVRRKRELQAALNDELAYLEALDYDVWECLANAIGEAWHHTVRHSALHAAHTSHAFVTQRLFRELERQPWNLVAMDPDEALDAISTMADDEIEHLVVHQISSLLRLGKPRRLLQDALLLLREASWTTKAAEQSHASITVVHRHHPEASAEQVALRAGLHACRHLFHDTDAAKREQALTRKLDAVSRKLGHAISGRNMFCSEFMKEAVPSAFGSQAPCARLARQAFARHHHHYELLPEHRKRHYDELAVAATRAHMCSVEGDVAHVKAALQLHRQRLEEERLSTGVPNKLGECRLDGRSLQQIDARLASGSFHCHSWSQRWFESPSLSEDQKAALNEYQPVAESRSATPAWVALVCKHRDVFRDCAFLSTRVRGKAWLLMYASQSPRFAMFLELRQSEEPVCRNPDHISLDLAGWHFAHDFRYDIGCDSFVPAEAIPAMEDGSDLHVVPDMAMLGSCRVGCDSEACELLAFRPLMALAPTAEEKPPRPSKPAVPATLLEQHPWIKDVLSKTRCKVKDATAEEEAKEDRIFPLADSYDDAEIDAAWQRLAAVHRDVASAPGLGSSDDFVCSVRTDGRRRVRNEESRHVSVVARGGLAKAWCQKFSVKVQHSYSMARFGEDSAWFLALETARRLQYFYSLYASSSDAANFRYSSDDLAALPECDEFCIWTRTLEEESAAWGRIADYVDTLLPVNP